MMKIIITRVEYPHLHQAPLWILPSGGKLPRASVM